MSEAHAVLDAPAEHAETSPPCTTVIEGIVPASAGRIGAFLGAGVGVVTGALTLLDGLRNGSAASVVEGYTALVTEPVVGAAVFGVAGLLFALLYNALAPRVGGLELTTR